MMLGEILWILVEICKGGWVGLRERYCWRMLFIVLWVGVVRRMWELGKWDWRDRMMERMVFVLFVFGGF